MEESVFWGVSLLGKWDSLFFFGGGGGGGAAPGKRGALLPLRRKVEGSYSPTGSKNEKGKAIRTAGSRPQTSKKKEGRGGGSEKRRYLLGFENLPSVAQTLKLVGRECHVGCFKWSCWRVDGSRLLR